MSRQVRALKWAIENVIFVAFRPSVVPEALLPRTNIGAESAARYPVFMDTMGDRIRMLRQSKGWTQEELGRRVGVHKVSVSQWETGASENIKLTIVLELLRELGTSLEYLVHGADRGAHSRVRRQPKVRCNNVDKGG